jgi:RNA polymerase sigma-70 factor (ECF subfamily)
LAEAVEELVLRARGGDADAFAELIGRYERSALAVAYGLLSDAHRAGDAVQDGFLKAWQELPRLTEAKKFGGWLLQIVRNAAVDIRRRKKATGGPDILEATAAHGPGPVANLEEEETARRVHEALQQLDELTRTMVTLRYYEGLSSKEIGEALGVSPASVDMRLSRARGQLKTLLAEVVSGTGVK